LQFGSVETENMMSKAKWAVLPMLVLAMACSSRGHQESTPDAADTADTADAAGDEETPVDASDGSDADTGVAAACNGSPLHAYDESPGVLEQIYVDLPSGSASAPFIVDMGSPISYWAGLPLPEGGLDLTLDGGTTTISCARETLPTLRGVTLGSDPDGVPFAGALGVDLVTRGAAIDLRIADSRFVWWHTPPSPPAGATVVPLTLYRSADAYNTLVASGIQLDGKEVRLILDTGSPHVVLVSKTPRPGEVMIHSEDANGEPLTLYTSTIEVSFGGGPKHTVAVDRTASFPSLEGTIAVIGEDVVGLLGLDALGHRQIVISRDNLAFVQ
jgi:hypothetical protein